MLKGKGRSGKIRRKVVAHTSKGSIDGEICYCNDITKERYCSFKHIPYARPPLGQLRFAGPRDFNLFEEVGYRGSLAYKQKDEEDVLRLHIYTPEVKDRDSEEKYDRPVIVFVPGQLYFGGYTTDKFYGPQYLLTQDVVLVVISYRQGFLGFTRFENDNLDAPGDAGLTDIIMAFHFVRNEIVNFGGNPDNVTAYGQGIGAGYVRAILIDPRLDNLFHKAILSSSLEHCINIEDASIFNGMRLAQVLSRQKPMNEKESLEFLRSLKYEDFKKVGDPVINNDTTRVVARPNLTRLDLDQFATKMPVMIGYNSLEGLIEPMLKPALYSQDWENFISIHLLMMRTCAHYEECLKLASTLKDTYKELVPKTEDWLHKEYFLSDVNYNIESLYLASHLANAMSPHDVFFYRCGIDLEYNCTKRKYGYRDTADQGAAHGDELGYIFKTMFAENVKKGSAEDQCIKRMTQMWCNFALKGDPNPDDPAMMDGHVWKPVQTPLKHCFNIYSMGADSGVEYCELPELDRLLFWQGIYKLNFFGRGPLPMKGLAKKGKKKRFRGKIKGG